MIEYLVALAIYYVGIGLLTNSLITLWLYNKARKEGFNVVVQWKGWLVLSLQWPYILYKIIQGVLK